MKKNYLRGVSKTLSEREMKLVVGGLAPCNASECVASGYVWDYANSVCDDGGACVGSGNGFWEGVQPCQNNGCPVDMVNQPYGGGMCCYLPCYGWFHDYGTGIVTGVNACGIV